MDNLGRKRDNRAIHNVNSFIPIYNEIFYIRVHVCVREFQSISIYVNVYIYIMNNTFNMFIFLHISKLYD